MSSINGSCLCGQIKFKVRGELRKVIFCHCTQCLKSHGHYGAYTATSKDDLTFIRQIPSIGNLLLKRLDGDSVANVEALCFSKLQKAIQ